MKKLLSLLLLLGATIMLKAQTTGSLGEVFIQITDSGRFTVMLGDEYIGSATGQFRFFDVPTGDQQLTISAGGDDLLSKIIDSSSGNRMIYTFSKEAGLKQIKLMPIYSSGAYALDNWDGLIDASNPDQLVNRPHPHFPGRFMSPLMDQQQFTQLLASIKSQAFDNYKSIVFEIATKGYSLYASQLCEALKLFSWDDDKLRTAFYAYDHLIDPRNFYQVRDLLIFSPNRDQVDKFVLQQ